MIWKSILSSLNFLSKLSGVVCLEMNGRNSALLLLKMSLISNNSRGTTFPEHLQRPLRSTLIASCILEFSHAREARNKEPPRFRWLRKTRLRRVCQEEGMGWGTSGEGDNVSRSSRALCCLSFLFCRLPRAFLQTVREEILERSWRDSVSREYRGLAEDSLSPRILLFAASPLSSLSLSSSSLFVSSSSYRFLSFNLRLDCRLHIVLFYGFCRSTFNFSLVPRCLCVFLCSIFFSTSILLDLQDRNQNFLIKI